MQLVGTIGSRKDEKHIDFLGAPFTLNCTRCFWGFLWSEINQLQYLLLLNLAPCEISIDSGVGPFRRVSGVIPNILSRALCPYLMYCFSNPIITMQKSMQTPNL